MTTYIDSTWTDEEIENEYLDTVTYDMQGSVELCKRFISACRAIIIRRPVKVVRAAGDSNQEATWDIRLLKEQLDAAQRWLAYSPDAHAGGRSNVIHPDFSITRDYGAGAPTSGRNYGTDV